MKAFIPIFLFLLCSAVHAATNIDPRVAKYDTCGRFEVYHVNGVLTEETDASINLDRIRTSYGNAYKEYLIKYSLAYNHSIGVRSDFLDAAKQIISAYAGATWEKWQNAVMFGVYDVGLPATTAAAIAKSVTELFSFLRPSPYQDSDLFYINAAIRSTTQSGARKLFVCHSQGNLYCNLVYDQLVAGGTAPQTMGIVGVAVPTFSLHTGNTYTTSSNDLVVAMRLFFV